MKVRGLWVAALLLAAVLLPWGCRFGPGSRAAAPERPKPVVQLAGQSYAYVVRDSSLLPTGVGAEGSPGDLLLENAFVRFVVASADHAGPAWLRGNLIDAAVQRGEDRMRLLVPLLGGSRPVRPTWETVTVANRGGPDEPGVVVSKGHLSDNASVKVETTYTLPPGARSLEITTKVLNETAGMLALFGCRDQLYHGRTARFAPSVGLFPAGKRGSSRWLAFFWQDRVWGIVAGPLGTMDGVHEVGVSELHYCTVDIPAGESRSYRRSLVAGVGGPEAVWLQAWPVPESTRSHLALTIRDRDTGEPVEGAQVHLEAADKRSPVVLVTDCLGKVALDLPGGKCKVRVRAAGRAPAGPHLLNCVAGSSHTLAIPISARAEAVVSVRARIGPYAAPTRARICSYLTRGFAGPVPAGPAFPTPSPAGVVLANGLTEVRLPLALTKGSLPVP
ncbi:MAG: carboxypeptidase regulatory-like domain-containing protein, partial [Candidatus Brocadiae bacterium]|nr:carboxypeptidase regulatory-like domain-containing protein [Candidatus Brocadiia bacterium]